MVWMVLFISLAFPLSGEAGTAASCSQADVSTEITNTPTGGTVIIPAGTCTWTSRITISGKALTIQGAGGSPPGTKAQCDVGGQTTYTCIKGGAGLLTYTTPSTGTVRVTGITFYPSGCSTCDTFTVNVVTFIGTNQNVRFDHNRFDPANAALNFGGYTAGVIDHNIFNITAVNAHAITTNRNNWNGSADENGDLSWANAHSKGGANNVFIEDNTFENDSGTHAYFTDGLYGCRVVTRFNTLDDGDFQVHGTETSGRYRGCRHQEIYNNTYTVATTFAGIGSFRGGSGYAFDNAMTGTITGSSLFDMTTLRRNEPWGSSGHEGQYPFGRCGQVSITSITRSGSTATATTASGGHYSSSGGSYQTISGADQPEYNGTFVTTGVNATTFTFQVTGTPATPASGTITMVSPFDGNTDSTGYPCLDQAGAGLVSVTYSGTGPACNCPPFSPDPLTQNVVAGHTIEPIGCWGNTDDGAASNCSTSVDVIQANRDYYNYTASFTGTSGIGVGTRASRPATCTTGVMYWSTDGGGNWNTSVSNSHGPQRSGADGGLDKCTATNTWTNDWYVPYTYPHPLVEEIDTTPPAVPTGLRVSSLVE